MIDAKKSWWVVEDLGGGTLRVVPFYSTSESFFRTEYFGETKQKALEQYIMNQDAFVKRQLREIGEAYRDRAAAMKLLEEVRGT